MALPKPGDLILEKYRVEALVGEGGFGRVYRATTVETGRRVAIKVLKLEATEGAVAHASRFLREMRAIASLQSAHTIKLYDYGRLTDGNPLMVCEYVEGEDLHALLARRGTLTGTEASHVLRQVLMSLAEAHRQGILHRDIKPSNIRICEYVGDPLRAKVLDFGLAKSLDGNERALTGTGHVIGTPRYMAPEQLTGGELTPGCDLYSAGLVALEMLIGSGAFRETPAMTQLEVPDDLDLSPHDRAVLQRLLARDPSTRWRSAEDVLSALDASVLSVPRTAKTTEPPHEPMATAETGERAVVFLALAAVAVGGVMVWWALQTEPTAVAPSRATSGSAASLLRDVPRQPDESPDASTADVRVPVEPAHPIGCGERRASGTYNLQIIDGLWARELAVHIPETYDPSVEHALVVLLHESAAQPAEFIESSGFVELAKTEQLVIVAPFGGYPIAWEDRPYETVRQAIDDALAELCIDPDRVYAVGHSSGGSIAEAAGCQLPQVRAVATTAMRRSTKGLLPCPQSPVPALHIVGRDDGYNPIEGGRGCSGTDKISLAERERRWRERNGCATETTTWLRRAEHLCRSWTGCDAPLVSCVLDGGRGWDGSGERLYDSKNCDGEPADFPYAQTIWDFFVSMSATP